MPLPNKNIKKKTKPKLTAEKKQELKQERREKHEKTELKKAFEKDMSYVKTHTTTLTKNEEFMKQTAPIPLFNNVIQQDMPRFLR